MAERNLSKLKNVWDFYRTAPLAETQVILATCAAVGEWNILNTTLNVMLGINILGGLGWAAGQFVLRNRLENSIKRFGYQDETFKTSIPQWCDRQTAFVVAERSGNLEAYKNLCESQRHLMKYRYIPTF